MPQITLRLDTIGLLDHGLAEAAINDALAVASRDLYQRGLGDSGDGKPRSVTIEITMAGAKHGDVEIDIQAQAKIPKYRTRPTVAQIKPRLGENGPADLLFRDMSPSDPRQSTIEDVPGEIPNE